MTTFLRLLADQDKAAALATTCQAIRAGQSDTRLFSVPPESFRDVPGVPFAYWVSDRVRAIFKTTPTFESVSRTAKQGLATADDFRFIRLWWEFSNEVSDKTKWFCLVKGGAASKFYGDVFLQINWKESGRELKAWASSLYNNSHWSRILKNVDYYFRPGLTWPLRGSRFSARVVPKDCIFSVAGKMAFFSDNEEAMGLSIFNSAPFDFLMKTMAGSLSGAQFESGLIQRTPCPDLKEIGNELSEFANKSWSFQRMGDASRETSHAFLLPATLRPRIGDYDPTAINSELARIQSEIDEIAFDLYGFDEADRAAVLGQPIDNEEQAENGDADDAADSEPIDTQAGLLSWCVGVACGRFDWRLATAERQSPPEPEPFDPLPAKSPGMLPDDAEPFHQHAGILVDDPGHPHDLTHLIESVLERVGVPAPPDVRRWLQREFFPEHLKQYSKSRRKAPIYWPLATTSGSYTLWVYYPMLNTQTLYTAVNDFVEPKLESVVQTIQALRSKTGSNKAEDKELEQLQDLELELTKFRDTLLQIAKDYAPNHDDGVQITAAPLWSLFRHKPWQKVLKDTWAKLDKGDYDWAHLAIKYWSGRVRTKCKTDKSLAIAHGLEDLYEEPVE